ncbi:G-protein subunit alpha 9 [Tieghemostelium lacteum]|uniref:G-protein subunit alpha 9 n=1 Tax=Tieghemostelium lacteum TaxID=361077 RepID=A0A152A1T7_TIELA|nr:G-protein subunit alpha 9 [Tieghemostelium lacteum]|eukprot:KYR00208.1 G-protein subunit alpha 9 [Tieghemostelium lacteum]
MGCGASIESKESKLIDKDLANERKIMYREMKLLLLGTGDSGKSTIAKQMRYIHTTGFNEDEISNFKDILQQNVLSCINILCRQILEHDLKLDSENKTLLEKVDYFSEINPFELPLTSDLGKEIEMVWSNEQIKKFYVDVGRIFLPEVAGYCLSQVARISTDDFKPNEEDILKCRQRTTGMKETVFTVEDVKFRLLDVGGQKNERRKWIHYFEDVKTIIFCASLSDYDIDLAEEAGINRMHDSLKLWEEIINNPFFKNTSVVLFLNKNDIFKEKISRIPLTKCFPEYPGPNDYDKALEYIRNKYFVCVPAGRSVLAHVTTATDRENITVVFDAVRRTVIAQVLKMNY